MPRSLFGTVLAALYCVVAAFIVNGDRGKVDGWTTMNGLSTFLITFPVSAIGEKLGMRPDFRRNPDMIFAIGICAVLVYFLGAALARLARQLLSTGGPP